MKCKGEKKQYQLRRLGKVASALHVNWNRTQLDNNNSINRLLISDHPTGELSMCCKDFTVKTAFAKLV